MRILFWETLDVLREQLSHAFGLDYGGATLLRQFFLGDLVKLGLEGVGDIVLVRELHGAACISRLRQLLHAAFETALHTVARLCLLVADYGRLTRLLPRHC